MSITEKLGEMNKGFCQVCNIELDDKRRYYCDEHKANSKYQIRIGEANTESIEIEKPKKTTSKKDNAKLQSDLSDVLLPILGGLINAWFLSPIDQLQLDDATQNKIIQDFAITDQELEILVKPIIRILLTSEATKSVSSKVVENSDVVEAISTGFIIYQRQMELRKIVENAINQSNSQNQEFTASTGFIGGF